MKSNKEVALNIEDINKTLKEISPVVNELHNIGLTWKIRPDSHNLPGLRITMDYSDKEEIEKNTRSVMIAAYDKYIQEKGLDETKARTDRLWRDKFNKSTYMDCYFSSSEDVKKYFEMFHGMLLEKPAISEFLKEYNEREDLFSAGELKDFEVDYSIITKPSNNKATLELTFDARVSSDKMQEVVNRKYKEFTGEDKKVQITEMGGKKKITLSFDKAPLATHFTTALNMEIKNNKILKESLQRPLEKNFSADLHTIKDKQTAFKDELQQLKIVTGKLKDFEVAYSITKSPDKTTTLELTCDACVTSDKLRAMITNEYTKFTGHSPDIKITEVKGQKKFTLSFDKDQATYATHLTTALNMEINNSVTLKEELQPTIKPRKSGCD